MLPAPAVMMSHPVGACPEAVARGWGGAGSSMFLSFPACFSSLLFCFSVSISKVSGGALTLISSGKRPGN